MQPIYSRVGAEHGRPALLTMAVQRGDSADMLHDHSISLRHDFGDMGCTTTGTSPRHQHCRFARFPKRRALLRLPCLPGASNVTSNFMFPIYRASPQERLFIARDSR